MKDKSEINRWLTNLQIRENIDLEKDCKDKLKDWTEEVIIPEAIYKIFSKEVRLIDNENEQRGIVSIEKAISIAEETGLDLVEIAPNSKPPVCKILDYGKYLYNIEKQEKLNKKKQHIIHVKEIRIRPNIGDYDLVTKLKRGQKFLENGDKLKITLMYRGREFFSRKEDGVEVLNKVVEILKDISVVDKPADLQGRRISIVLSPK